MKFRGPKAHPNRKAHSLQLLWERLRPAVQNLGNSVVPSEKIEGINYYVQQLNEIDHDSARFRYASGFEEIRARMRKAQKPSVPADLRTFAEAMERLANYLSSLDEYVATIIEHYREMAPDAGDYGFSY